MNAKRVLPIVAALLVVVALVGLALVAGRDGDDERRVLPVLDAGAAKEAAAGSDLSVAGYNEYVLPDDLPALPDEAPAYELPGTVDFADVRALAEVLGVDGEVRPAEWGWTAKGADRQLDVTAGAGASWSYYAVAEAEAVPLPDEAAGDVAAPTLSIDRDRAERQGRALLADLGVDLDEAAVRVEDGWSNWMVSADPEVGGLPTIGFATSVGIGADDRVEFANGWLAPTEVLADYPLAGVREVVEGANAREERWAEEITEDPERWVFEVERVRLGLALSSTYESGAPAYLVPSYLLLTEDGWEASFFAVVDELLAPAPAAEAPVDDHDHGHDDEAPHGTAAEVCTAQTSLPDEAPAVEELQLCGPATAAVGQPVTFVVTASGLVRDDCASPLFGWGDGSEQPVCEIGCTALPTERTEVVREAEHVYDEPGTYAVEVVLAGCPGGEQARISVEVQVEA